MTLTVWGYTGFHHCLLSKLLFTYIHIYSSQFQFKRKLLLKLETLLHTTQFSDIGFQVLRATLWPNFVVRCCMPKVDWMSLATRRLHTAQQYSKWGLNKFLYSLLFPPTRLQSYYACHNNLVHNLTLAPQVHFCDSVCLPCGPLWPLPCIEVPVRCGVLSYHPTDTAVPTITE